MKQFTSKFGIDELVEYEDRTGSLKIGTVQSVLFRRYDSVNVTCDYNILIANSPNADVEISEHSIKKVYKGL